MMLIFRRSLPVLLALSLFMFIACQDEDEDAPPDGTGGGVPAGMARLYGTVRDGTGQPVQAALLHVIYPVETGSPDGIMTPSVTFIFDTTQLLTTTCGGNVGLSDGVMVKVYWDQNNNGIADGADPLAPLCDYPPDCVGGPTRTVNYNEFPLNGQDMFGVPGWFAVDRDFVATGDVLVPNRFYLRIFCTDGNVLWESELIDFPPGPSEVQFDDWTCHQCEGTPEVPRWYLDSAFPNPTRNIATIRFGLEQAAQALLTLRELSRGRVDTLMNIAHAAGAGSRVHDLSARANGLYEFRFSAGGYQNSRTLLKNETNLSLLQGTPEIAHSLGDGAYRFDTAAGVSIDRRGENSENLGFVPLNAVRLVAMKAGYQTFDTTFTVASAESLRVDLTLRAP